MLVIFTTPLQTWSWQQCVPILINIMGYLTVNICYVVRISVQVLSYPFRSQIKIQQTRIQQKYFMFTVMFHVLLCMANVYRLFPAQDGPFFYMCYHLSALQNCAVLFSTNFQNIFIFKNALHNLVIELCSALFFSNNILQLYINFTHSFEVHSNESACRKKWTSWAGTSHILKGGY